MLFLFVLLSFLNARILKVDDKYMPYVGNGFVAMKFKDPAIFVSGLFNGRGLDVSHVSHRATIPNYLQSIIFESGQTDISYELDVKSGVFYRRSTLQSVSLPIEEVFYAHRSIPNLLVYEVSSLKGKLDKSICFEIKNTSGTDDLDIISYQTYKNLTLFRGRTKIEETEFTGIQIIYFIKPTKTKFCSNFESTFRYTLSFGSNSFPLYEKLNSLSNLIDTHKSAWEEIWQTEISVEGDDELNTVIHNSIYYILSSIPKNGNFSLSPGSLSSNSYNGHTFWDAETWMYPTLVPLFPDFGKSCLNYRLNLRYGASLKASLNGYEGYMFPWESALSGKEVCPLSAATGKFEQHISSDVVVAFKTFYDMYNTKISKSEKLEFYDLIKGVAEFWTSRVTIRPSNTSLYDILLVIPPDEYHEGSNSVFTNAGAQISLEFATNLGKLLNPSSVNPQWENIANNLFFPTRIIEGKIVDWEFEDYKGDKIKQADVVLLAYPLMWKNAQMKNNLEYYQDKVDKNGPSMTYGIHSIEWLEIGNETAGYDNFLRSFQLNVQKPFYVWTEVQGGSGAVNFITGAGNFLQGVVFGYGGMRILDSKLRLKPILIPNTNKLVLSRVHYQDVTFSLEISKNQFTVTSNDGSFIVELSKGGEKIKFVSGTSEQFNNQEVFIYV